MTLTLDLSPDLEMRLQRAAAKQGLDATEYIRRLIEHQLPPEEQGPPSLWETLTPEEWKREFRAWVNSHDPQKPPLPAEAFERANFYGERG